MRFSRTTLERLSGKRINRIGRRQNSCLNSPVGQKNKYRKLFRPDHFDLVISDEAHRSLGARSRKVFEYFIGFKLGLTATPKDYLKSVDVEDISSSDPRQLEKRMMLDTYTTFGCESGEPTYRYSLEDGVKDGYLVNPKVIDARTEITTELSLNRVTYFKESMKTEMM